MTTDTTTPSPARSRTPEELAVRRLRGLALGLLAAVVVADALQGPLRRYQAAQARALARIDPLGPEGGGFASFVVDLLATSDRRPRA